MLLTVAKNQDRIPVEVLSLEDPRVEKLIAEHGLGGVFLDDVPLSQIRADAAAQAEAEAKAREEAKAKAKADADAKAQADAEAKIELERKALAEAEANKNVLQAQDLPNADRVSGLED